MTDRDTGFTDVPPTSNIPSILHARAARSPERVLFSVADGGGGWSDITAAEFEERVVELAAGLVADGVEPGDRVAIMSRTRYEWSLADFAIWYAGAVSVPIYETSSPAQIAWIIEDSGARRVIAENDDIASRIALACPATPVWVIDKGDLARVASASTDLASIDTRRRSAQAHDVATIIYTSGTTGRPKGCELTHHNFVSLSSSAGIALPEIVTASGASTLLFITLAHVFARFIAIMCVDHGIRVGHEPDTSRLLPSLSSFRPTFLLAVPRVFEKVYNASAQKAESAGKGKIFRRAAAVAIAYSRASDTGTVPVRTRVLHAIFDLLVYRTLRAALGGRATHAVSGSAPLGDRLGHFYRGIGLTVLEGYGLTETTAPIAVNTVSNCRIGTVGRALPGSDVRIADDGEVQVRGIGVFAGYANNPEATANAFTADGWLRTGDIGTLSDGFLSITGRSKELIVTAGGKNVAPAALEDRIRAHPIISQVVVIGDQRPFIAALVTLDTEMLPTWLSNRGVTIDGLSLDEMRNAPIVRERIQAAIDRANGHVSRAESIRKWEVLDHDLTEQSGHLTPSLKVKRDVVLRDFATIIDRIYEPAIR